MYYLLPFAVWPILYLVSNNFLFNNDSIKLTRNLIGFVDASACCIGAIGYYLYNNKASYEYSILFPISYYIWDTYLIIIKDLKKEIMYVYHHVIALLMLNELFFAEQLFVDMVYPILVSAELCNIPLYISYYIIKTYPLVGDAENKIKNIRKIIYAKAIQIFVFVVIRVIYYSYLFFYTLEDIPRNKYFKGAICTIYVMGIFWLFNQTKGFLNDVKLYKTLKNEIQEQKND
tara:strand:- start:30 stop:722 length:693 start_codon:yes stop_codon:yes gene_type:complete